MSTRTDSCIRMVNQTLERHRADIDQNQFIQDMNLKVKMKRGWPFRIVVTINYCHDQGDHAGSHD